jgi:hypothetical protein
VPSNIREAERTIDVFNSVGAREFFVTKTNINQRVKWGKSYLTAELNNLLPAMIRTATTRRPVTLDNGDKTMAGENLIVRPTGPGVSFVQLDDLSAEQLDRVRPASFLMLATSPGNHQAWIAVSGVNHQFKEFMRRVRRAVGGNDKSASHATRLAGTENFKVKYRPDYPVVSIVHAAPGRVMTPEQLEDMGLVAAPEPVKSAALIRSSHKAHAPSTGRAWPSYEITLSRTRAKKDGSGPDRSLADFNWSMIALTGGKSIEDTIAKLLEVSPRAQERAARRDEGYARVTVENAAAAVALNYGKGRSRA